MNPMGRAMRSVRPAERGSWIARGEEFAAARAGSVRLPPGVDANREEE